MIAGILGVGLLGSAIAARLSEAGWSLRAFDPDPAAREPLPNLAWADDAQQAAAGATHLIICLPNSDVTARLAPALFPALAPGAWIIDCTTGNPDQMAQLGELATSTGRRYLDATIAGSSNQTRSGDVLILVGGDPHDLAAARPLLESISPRIVHVGPCGYGARMKLVNNLALGLHRAVLAEALHLADALGLDAEQTLAVLRDGPAYSRIMDRKGPRMLHRDYTPEARLTQHHKDVRLMLAAARELGIRLPLSEVHDGLLGEAEAAGFADQDNSAVIEAYRRQKTPPEKTA